MSIHIGAYRPSRADIHVEIWLIIKSAASSSTCPSVCMCSLDQHYQGNFRNVHCNGKPHLNKSLGNRVRFRLNQYPVQRARILPSVAVAVSCEFRVIGHGWFLIRGASADKPIPVGNSYIASSYVLTPWSAHTPYWGRDTPYLPGITMSVCA